MEEIDSPAFGIDMDPSHIHRAGENPVEAIAAVVLKSETRPYPRLQGNTAWTGFS